MRKRLLDPGFFLNEELAECDPMARLLFAGLTLYCDKEGKFEWRPKRIRGAIFPHDHDIDITNLLGQLQASAFITQYNVNGNDYAIIPTFLKHQSPHIREKRSSIPDPPPEIPGNSTEFPEIPVTSVPVPVPISVKEKEPEFLKDQKLPDVEEIMFSSGPKLKRDLEEIANELKNAKLFPKAFAFKNKALKEKKNLRAVLHTLKQCFINRPDEPWAYCTYVLGVEDGNYNEREATGSSPRSQKKP